MRPYARAGAPGSEQIFAPFCPNRLEGTLCYEDGRGHTVDCRTGKTSATQRYFSVSSLVSAHATIAWPVVFAPSEQQPSLPSQHALNPPGRRENERRAAKDTIPIINRVSFCYGAVA